MENNSIKKTKLNKNNQGKNEKNMHSVFFYVLGFVIILISFLLVGFFLKKGLFNNIRNDNSRNIEVKSNILEEDKKKEKGIIKNEFKDDNTFEKDKYDNIVKLIEEMEKKSK